MKARWAEHIVRLGENRDAYSVLVGKPVRTRPLGKPRHERGENNIETNFEIIGEEGLDWNDLDQDRDQCRHLVNSNDPSGSIKYGEIC